MTNQLTSTSSFSLSDLKELPQFTAQHESDLIENHFNWIGKPRYLKKVLLAIANEMTVESVVPGLDQQQTELQRTHCVYSAISDLICFLEDLEDLFLVQQIFGVELGRAEPPKCIWDQVLNPKKRCITSATILSRSELENIDPGPHLEALRQKALQEGITDPVRANLAINDQSLHRGGLVGNPLNPDIVYHDWYIGCYDYNGTSVGTGLQLRRDGRYNLSFALFYEE